PQGFVSTAYDEYDDGPEFDDDLAERIKRGRHQDYLWVPLTRPSWHMRAACRDAPQEVFFSEKRSAHTKTRAIDDYCGRCPVRAECLEFALATPSPQDFGLWAGTTRRERLEMRRTRYSTD